MALLPLNLAIAVAWAAAAGSFDVVNLLLGYAAGFVALRAFAEVYGGSSYHARVIAALRLGAYFAWDLTRSSLRVAHAVIVGGDPRARFVRMKLDVKGDFGITTTANLISLTPGTLSVDVSDDRSELLIHAMFADDPEEVCQGLKDGIERRVMRVTP